MKIGFVLDDTLDTPDGVQQYVLTVGTWLSQHGYEVHYLVGHTERSDLPGIHSLSRNLHVKFNGNKMSMPLPTGARRLRAFLSEQNFDVLHVQVPYSPFLAGRILQVVPKRTAVIGTFHILPYSESVRLANRLLAVLNRGTGRRFDRMLAVSAPARDFAKKIYGYDADVVPNPLKLSQFTDVESGSYTTNVIFLGRLVRRKGAMQLLEAIHIMLQNGMYNAAFRVFIGGKGELMPELATFIEMNKMSDVVKLSGFVDEKDKPEFLAAADIAVYPSTGGESFGIVLLEAMAAARGVVLAGNNPGYASVMQPYPDQLFDPHDVQGLAEKLAWYLEHPAARARASELQQGYVKRFDIENVGAQLMAIYGEALETRARQL